MRRKYLLGAVALLLAGSMAAAWIVRSVKSPPPAQLVAGQLPGAGAGPNLPLTE